MRGKNIATPRPLPRPRPRRRRAAAAPHPVKKKIGAPAPRKKKIGMPIFRKKNRPKITFFSVFTRFLRSYAKTDIKFEIYAKNYVYRLIFSTVRPNFIENMSDAV